MEHEILIFDVLDGLATTEQQQLFAELMANDTSFAVLYKGMKESHELLQSNTVVDVPEGFANNVMKALEPKMGLNHYLIESSFFLPLVYSALALLFLYGYKTLQPYLQAIYQIQLPTFEVPFSHLLLPTIGLLTLFIVVEFTLIQRKTVA